MAYKPDWLKTDIKKDYEDANWNYDGWKSGDNRLDLTPPPLVNPRKQLNAKPMTDGIDLTPVTIPQPQKQGFWDKARNTKLQDIPVLKYIAKPFDKAYEIPITQRFFTTLGNTIGGEGNVKADDGSAMQKMDAGKIGNLIADIAGTGVAYGMKLPGMNNSIQGGINSVLNPLEAKALSKLPSMTKAGEKAAEYGINAIKSGIDMSAGNVIQGVAQGENIKDIGKSGVNGLWQGALFGTAIKGAGDIAKSAFPKWKVTYDSEGNSVLKPQDEVAATKQPITMASKYHIKNTKLEKAVEDYNSAIEAIHNHFQTNQLTSDEVARIKPELGIDLDQLVSNVERYNSKPKINDYANSDILPYAAGVKEAPSTIVKPVVIKPQAENIPDLLPLKPGSKVTFNGREFTLGNKGIDGQYELLSSSGKPVLSTTADNIRAVPGESILSKGKASATVQDLSKIDAENSVKKGDKLNFEELLKNSDSWKDKSPMALMRETWDRNIIDIAGQKDGQKLKEALFDPIHENEAKRIRFMNEERAKIKALNLTEKESAAVQKFGEGKYYENTGKDIFTGEPVLVEHAYTLSDLKEEFPDSWDKVAKATEVFRDFYKRVYPMVNESLARNGYKPIGQIDNYFPHFTKDNPILKALGVSLDVKDLPTDINGLTHQFKPGKNWVANFQNRTGDITDFGAVEGFDRYIEGASKVIHHTDDIKNLREFTKSLRLKYSSAEVSQEIENIMSSNMDKSLKDAAIEELLGRGNTQLSNSVADLDEFTNVLAGKKDLADRADERKLGRVIYNISNTVMGRIAKNMVALNPGSWLTNFIPLTQSAATTGKKEFIKAMGDTLKSLVEDDNFVNKSTFLTNRQGSDILSKGISDKASDVLTYPMQWIDNFTSQVVTRSKYLENIKKGMPEGEALKKADEWAAKIMGDRSLGAQPTLFNMKSPLTKLLTQFQLEVNNQMSFILKDMPREYLSNGKSKENIKKISSAVGQMALFGFLYNELYSMTTGRRPAIDPIGEAVKFGKDLSNPNIKKSDAVTNLAKDAVSQLPFAGGIIGGGRIPISSALPDFNKIWGSVSKMSTGEMGSAEGLKGIGSSLGNTALYTLPPFGGGQIKKTAQAVKTLSDKGVYNADKTQLKYPVDANAGNIVKGLLFGTSSLKESQDFYDNNRAPLSANQTEIFKAATGKKEADKDIKKEIEDRGLENKTPKQVYNSFLDERTINKAKDEVYNYKKQVEKSLGNTTLSKNVVKNIEADTNKIVKDKTLDKDEKIQKLRELVDNYKKFYK